MGSDTSTTWYQSISIRLPTACMFDPNVIAWCHVLLSVGSVYALRWGVASVGSLLYWVWLTLYGKNISGARQAPMGSSHPGPRV